MPGLDVIGCSAAIASAFHMAAELVRAIQESRDKKKRRKDKELELIVEEKLLYKSLLEGENRCRECSADRYRRFGEAFSQGDEPAIAQLKDIVVALQCEVIHTLQTVRTTDTIPPNLTNLYEASITSRRDAIRVMDDLCHRILTRGEPYMQFSRDGCQSPDTFLPSPQHVLTQPHKNSFDEPFRSYPSATMPVSGSLSQSSPVEGQRSILHRLLSSRHSIDLTVQKPTKTSNPLTSRSSPPRSVPTDHDRVDSPQLIRQQSKAHRILGYPAASDVEVGRSLSRHSSIRGGETDSYHRATSSISSSTASDAGGRDSMSDTSFLDPIDNISLLDELEHEISEIDSTDIKHIGNAKTGMIPSSDSVLSTYVELPATPEADLPEDEMEALRALSAPEVLTKEFESMLSKREQPRPLLSMSPPATLSNIHPAFRDFYQLSPIAADKEPENVWEPLARPAKHNEYHGFCKGAWQCRKSVQEGLSIRVVPNANGQDVPHWACKQCKFLSKAKNSSNLLPDQVYFHARSNIRYRWLFLAKSHVSSDATCKKYEDYKYGCIFCAAEGRITAVYESLDAVMMHISAKHKTSMMTPETKRKTRCVVGGIANRAADWDINLPETRHRSASGAVGEFVVSAVTGLSKYGT